YCQIKLLMERGENSWIEFNPAHSWGGRSTWTTLRSGVRDPPMRWWELREPGRETGVHLKNEGASMHVLSAAWLCTGGMLCGCTSIATEGTSAGAGIAGAAIAHPFTRNAGVITGIGLGVQAAARAGLQYAERKIHQAEQDRIAAAAGPLPVGAVGKWRVV